MTVDLPPPPARPTNPNVLQRAAADPGASVWVGASAGTGKTKVLTDRVLRLMLADTAPDRILCLTFTKAAAAEMANRLHRTLAAWATLEDADLDRKLYELTARRPDEPTRRHARRLFARVLEAPGGMKIQTIHAFCQSLLRRFPVEADVPPHFELVDDRTAEELMRDLRDRLFQAPPPDVAAALAAVTAAATEDAFDGLIRGLNAERGRLSRLLADHGGVDGLAAAVRRSLGVREGDTAEDLRLAACKDAAFDAAALRRIAGVLTAAGAKTDVERGRILADWLARPAAERAAGWGAWRKALLTDAGEVRKTLCTKGVATAEPDAPDILAAEAARIAAVEDRIRATETAAATAALLTVGSAMIERYTAAKRARALVDYDDLILATVDLLDRPDVAPWVLYKLDGGLDHIL
ncbi:MAG: UvrD-helicase domain-containing protein, partial [Alphaproteobacteria bacterium]|nr:UvrD-helicase domain-containing protein [Alphaproteobacteria bacterium]